MKILGQSLLVAVCVFGSVSASQAGIINGSFEDIRKQDGTAQSFTGGGGTWGYFDEIMGWSATAPTKIEVGRATVYGVTGQDGLNVLELDATSNAIVSQIVAVPGGSYNLSFLAALRQNVAPTSGELRVYWNNVLIDTYQPMTTAMLGYSETVIALANNTLRFEGFGTSDTYGALVDNVQLTSVPDGGTTLALLGLTLAGFGVLRRRMS